MLCLYRVCTCKATRLDAIVEVAVCEAGHVLRGADLTAPLVVAVVALDTLADSLHTTADTEQEEGEKMHGDGEIAAGGMIKQLDTALCCCCYNTTPLLLHSTE